MFNSQGKTKLNVLKSKLRTVRLEEVLLLHQLINQVLSLILRSAKLEGLGRLHRTKVVCSKSDQVVTINGKTIRAPIIRLCSRTRSKTTTATAFKVWARGARASK
jgi:hypothetical protein